MHMRDVFAYVWRADVWGGSMQNGTLYRVMSINLSLSSPSDEGLKRSGKILFAPRGFDKNFLFILEVYFVDF